jgi:hypothetical protein
MQDAEQVPCPLCHGEGKVSKLKLADDADATRKLGPSQAAPAAGRGTEGVIQPSATANDFQRDVHTWNPRLPIWRRSPKE